MSKYVITITRQFGSLGRPIAQKMSEKLGINFYDRDILDQTAQKLNLPVAEVGQEEESVKSSIAVKSFFKMAHPLGNVETTHKQTKIYEAQENIIRFLAEKESCIVVGRCSDYILAEEERAVHIYIYAPYKERLKNSIEELGLTEEEARKMIKQVDDAREAYHQSFAGFKPDDKNFKDIMIDSSFLGVEGTADYLVKAIKAKFDLE